MIYKDKKINIKKNEVNKIKILIYKYEYFDNNFVKINLDDYLICDLFKNILCNKLE